MNGLLARTVTRTRRVVGFIVYFAYEFLHSNLMVLQEIFRPRPRGKPAVIAVPLRSTRPIEIVSISNLITLTPGTLTLEVATDPPTLYVHGMFADDPDNFVAGILEMENRLLAAMRPVGSEEAGS